MPIGHWRQSANGHRPWLLIHRTRIGSRPSSAIQLYSAIQRAVEYTAIHRYTLYTLYNTPLLIVHGTPSNLAEYARAASTGDATDMAARLVRCSNSVLTADLF